MGKVIIQEKAYRSGQEPRVFNPLETQPLELTEAVNNICDMMTMCKDEESVITQHTEQQQVESERQTRSKIQSVTVPPQFQQVWKEKTRVRRKTTERGRPVKTASHNLLRRQRPTLRRKNQTRQTTHPMLPKTHLKTTTTTQSRNSRAHRTLKSNRSASPTLPGN